MVRNFFFRLLIVFLLTLLFMNCAPRWITKAPTSSIEHLADQIDLLVADPELATAFLGIMIQSAKTGEILYQHNAQKLLMPASNEKILTGAAALINLGPDFVYETKLYARGNVVDTVLHGDLIVFGAGDPTISYRFCDEKDTCRIFKQWIQTLKAKGISKITGNLIGVDDVFDDESIGFGWTLNDLSYSYAAQIGGLMFNENCAYLKISVDSLTNAIHITVSPDIGYLQIVPNISLIKEKKANSAIHIKRMEGSNTVIINGQILETETHEEEISIHNPTCYFLSALRAELTKAGIIVNGSTIDSDELTSPIFVTDANLIDVHKSRPFLEILTDMMKESQNLYAESFVKLLGYRLGDEGNFKEGERIVKNTLRRLGLEESSYRYRDGSGLSRYNYVSPDHIVKILRRMHFHKYSEAFRSTLPVAGVDGTLNYRLKGTLAEGKILAKTGTISNVRCLSGYALSTDDEVLVFSIMANNFLCDVNVVMDLQDRICMLLTSFSRKW